MSENEEYNLRDTFMSNDIPNDLQDALFEEGMSFFDDDNTANKKEYRPNPILIPLSIIFAGALIAGALIYNGRIGAVANNTPVSATNTQVTQTAPAVSTSTVTVSIQGSYSEGSKDAKIAFVEFGDYQCPYCQSLFQNVIPSLRTDYINTNKVYYTFENYPLTSIHPVAMIGSEAALCAGEQNKYWQMNDAIYSATDTSQNDQAKLETYANQIGLDMNKYDSCIKANTYASTIATETDRGNKIGVQGTPTIVIGTIDYKEMTVTGHIIYGAYPYSTFKQEIDSYLK